MMQKKLSEILGAYFPKNCNDTSIKGLSADSRNVQEAYAFFAIKGQHTDSHDLIPELLKKNPGAFIIEHALSPALEKEIEAKNITLIRVDHSRSALSYAAAAWHDFPSKNMKIIGITGTDGKSSTVYFLWQLLRFLGLKAGFFSTVSLSYGDEAVENPLRQSSPEPLELEETLAKMRDNGVSHVVMESTSHGLSPLTARLKDIDFYGGIFTNLSHEHLEFHGSYEQYRHDKANLMRRATEFSVINRGDKEASYFAKEAAGSVLLYQNLDPEYCNKDFDPHANLRQADLYAEDIEDLPDSLKFTLKDAPGHRWPCRLNFPGFFNAENCMAALLGAQAITKASLETLIPLIDKLEGVKGRMIPLHEGQDFTVIVDYAHTPGSYSRLFPLFKKICKGRLLALFGSAGERDVEKRPMQGKIASEYADILILTNEDPRLEKEEDILDQIASGIPKENTKTLVYKIPDRYEAIKKAFALAKPEDVVLLLGKGHEQSLVKAQGKIPWDESEKARLALRELLGK